MLDTADSSSPNHALFDAGFDPKVHRVRRIGNRPSIVHHTDAPVSRSQRDINTFQARRGTYSKRELPRQLDCAPKGGRLLCRLEEKFASRGFTWAPVIRCLNGEVVEFGHDAEGYAVLTQDNAHIVDAPAGTRVTVEFNSSPTVMTAFLIEITVEKDGSVSRQEQLGYYSEVAGIDIVCANKPTFNGEDVTFEDLYFQKASIFDAPLSITPAG